MNLIFKIAIGLQKNFENANTLSNVNPNVNIVELILSPLKKVGGLEILEISPRKFMLSISDKWGDLREKELAALRRTITGAAIEIGEKLKPAIVYSTDIDLCGLAGMIVSKVLSCPFVIGLRANEIEEGLFNERKVAILDSCINAANAIIVPGIKEAKLLKGYYKALSDKIEIANDLSVTAPEIENVLRNRVQGYPNIPWKRQPTKLFLVSRPLLTGRETAYIEDVLRSGWWGYGPVSNYLENLFVQLCGGNVHALAVSSCTAALHLSLMCAGVGPGDEVIVPALTFISTAMAVVHVGATPVFADVDPSTLSILPGDVERKLSSKTKAVIPVHFAGIPADIDSIRSILNGRIVIIEDAAHAIGAKINSQPIGSFSPFTCFSFATTKQIPSCAGGMLIYKDDSFTTKLKELSNLGLHIDTHMRSTCSGAAPANEVLSIGYRYRMNDITAAIAVSQFHQLEDVISRRSALVERYNLNLAQINCCELIGVPVSVVPSWYIMPIRVPISIRNRLRNFLADNGIDTSIHYPSLTEQPFFRNMNKLAPIALNESKRLVSLPLHLGLTNDDVDKICFLVSKFISDNYNKNSFEL